LDYRARLHDERADLLERAEGDPGLRLGAIPYHREHGNDPQGAGRAALRTALEHAVAVGYSAATVDYGMRGRLLCDPVLHQQDYCHFSAKAASALIPLGDLSKCAEIYHELQQRYALPRVHMTCSYAIAMLHTRFYEPRDHEVALGWLNNARALASLERDPVEGPYFQVYQDNGLALVEMHRGNLEHALELINKGIARLAREVPEDRYIVHRSQLLHNRARLLAALGRLEAAYADFTSLIEWDPWHVEYHTDRGNLSRRSGDLTAALADYDRAIEVSVPLPELYYNRATIRFDRGDVAGALADLDYLLDMEPGFAPARLLRATLRLDEGDTDGARHDVCAGLREQAGDPELTTLLGLVQQATGDKEGALASFNEALAADPGLVCALANRAALAFELGRIESSVDDLTCALERSGTDADLLFNRGFVLQHLGRYEEAVQDFTGALQAGGVDRPDALQHRATCLMEAGRVARAREDLQELRDLGCDERASAIEALFDSEESRAA
jgi:tetratricopeptide (TPR) repeat protein